MTSTFDFQQIATIDWLTMTVRDPELRGLVQFRSKELWHQVADEGQRVRSWSWRGYTGMASPHVSWGTRQSDDIIILKGQVCGAWWREFALFAEQVSRVDLAVTVEGLPGPVRVAWDAWQKLRSEKEIRGLGRSYSYIQGLNGGDTLYVNKRISQEYGRLYDKGYQESSGPEGTKWRYEVEIKKPLAKQAVEILVVTRDVPDAVSRYVYDWFDRRLVRPIFLPGTTPLKLERDAKITSAEITLAWLQRSVRPSIIRLMADGKMPELLAALGLDISNA